MIKFLPVIYPEESIYSYLARIYVRSGYSNYRSFAREIFKNESEYPDYIFYNIFSSDFLQLLKSNIDLSDLILNHTLFKYYSIFMKKSKRNEILNQAVNNEIMLCKQLQMPTARPNYKLRYCPLCVKEDRIKFGECYYHINHQIYDIHICAKHKCELIDTNIKITKEKDSVLRPLEILDLKNSINLYNENDINYKITCYINNIFNINLQEANDINIGDYLAVNLKDKYLSGRGRQKNLELIYSDTNCLYKELINNTLSKQRLNLIYRNKLFNVYNIFLIAFFENISCDDLILRKNMKQFKYFEIDKKVKKMVSSGKSYNSIAKELNIDKETIRKINLNMFKK